MAEPAAPDAKGPLVAADLAIVHGQPAMVSVMPIVPSSDRMVQDPGSEYIHVSVKFIDADVLAKIADQYLLANAHLAVAPSPDGASIDLRNAAGEQLGIIAWNPNRPGLTLARKAGPAILGVAVLSTGLLAFLLRRLRRASLQLQVSQGQAQYLAFHDTLTGLPNRALFEDRLKRALVTVKRGRGKIALIYLDLDRFKYVNDTFGHPAGDELVRQTAKRLGHAIREADTVARLGGDEFAIILVDIRGLRTAEDLCERLLDDLGQPFELGDNQVFISASIGIALAPESGADPDELLRKADIALYEAKKNGRARYQVFAGDMDEVVLRRRIIENEMRTALEGGSQFRLAYQSVHAADGLSILGAEALIRWDHPIHGAISPAHFIAIAEERGMITLLGEWVLREACRFAASTGVPWVAINVSPLQLREDSFVDRTIEILEDSGISPSRIQMEITENVLINNVEATAATLTDLRARGIKVALDDFGTGYSSINYLRRYAIDKLKIDRSFVRLLGTSESADAIIKALIDLANALRIQITAEGVETAEQRDLLIAMGCHELQGFLLSSPVSLPQWRATYAALPDQSGRPMSVG
jgi:diguanylate cyclase (GGDEF)-like protein